MDPAYNEQAKASIRPLVQKAGSRWKTHLGQVFISPKEKPVTMICFLKHTIFQDIYILRPLDLAPASNICYRSCPSYIPLHSKVIAVHFFFAAAAEPAFALGLEASLTLVLPLVSPLDAGALLGPPADFFGAPAPVAAGFLAATPAPPAAGFFAAAAPVAGFFAAPAPAPALLAVLGFFAGICGLLLGVGL